MEFIETYQDKQMLRFIQETSGKLACPNGCKTPLYIGAVSEEDQNLALYCISCDFRVRFDYEITDRG